MANLRQTIAVNKLVEISRKAKGQKNVTIGKILREAGYSENTAIKPSQVTQSKGFLELLHEAMPDNEVSALQTSLMKAAKLDSYKVESRLSDKEIQQMVEDIPGCKVRKITRYKNDPFVTVYFWSPDVNGRTKALDMFYKLTNAYPKEREEGDANLAIKTYLDKLSKVLP